MPEGDTIHRTAAALRRAIGGQALRRVTLPRLPAPHPAVGAVVERIEARGKHLLIHTGDGLTVHTHQRMTGSWHLYAAGERWRKPARAARVVLGVLGTTAVCFNAPVVEVLDTDGLRRHPTLRRLGPDLCDPEGDLEVVVERAVTRLAEVGAVDRTISAADPTIGAADPTIGAADPTIGAADPTIGAADPTIGELLLDQRIACGIGNIYRSEVLFLHGIDPRCPLTDVDTETRRALFTTAATLLRANLDTTARTTVRGAPPGSLWVYGRDTSACRRCGTVIERHHLGDHARVVFLCPSCQPSDQGHGTRRSTASGR